MRMGAGRTYACAFAVCISGAVAAHAADPVDATIGARQQAPHAIAASVAGRVSVLDGRTLWFPQDGVAIRLAGIDACELPQWAFDPDRETAKDRQLKPVPCGPLAKAWLKRAVHGLTVTCRIEIAVPSVGRCSAGSNDLALELLKVGWARVADGPAPDPVYRSMERYAKAARYGMWHSYVLEMNEWRAAAVDRTLSRRPVADFNLLRERHSEISPPFTDAWRLPKREDR